VVDTGSRSDDALWLVNQVIAMLVIVCFVVLTMFMYMDMLATKAEVKDQLEKIDRMRKQVEKEKKQEDVK